MRAYDIEARVSSKNKIHIQRYPFHGSPSLRRSSTQVAAIDQSPQAFVIKLEQINVNTTKKEVSRGIPCDFDVEKNMFLMTDTDPDDLGEALARVGDSRMSDGDAGGTHALATGVKPRGGGQGRGGGARRDRGSRGNARGRRDGKDHQPHHHQQQWALQPLGMYRQEWASKPLAQQQQPQKHQWQPQQKQRQPQHQQRQPQQQQKRPPGHPGGWGPPRACFRCGQPGHFYAECRAIPPAPLNACLPAPYITPQDHQQVNYSAISPGDYASSSGEHRHL